MKAFIFDASKCNGCHNCQIACKDEHCGNEWLPYALSQPDTGHFWMKVDCKEHGQTPKVKLKYRVVMCNHCNEAPCAKAFPDCIYQRDDGLVIIDPIKAKGKRGVAESCPYDRIYWNDDEQVAQKCTGCAHLVDEGGVPHCVDLCATGALRFGDEEDFAEEIANSVVLTDGPSRVYYLNLPKFFAAGEVWDPCDNEIIEGAEVKLKGEGVDRVETTDGFGDFWFKGLGPGNYELQITHPNYMMQTKEFYLDKSLNLGDFPLRRV